MYMYTTYCSHDISLGQKKSLWFLVIRLLQKSVRWRANQWNMWYAEQDQISQYIKYGGLERPHKSVKRSYPYVKSHLKYSMAEFQSIQQFWLQLDIIS